MTVLEEPFNYVDGLGWLTEREAHWYHDDDDSVERLSGKRTANDWTPKKYTNYLRRHVEFKHVRWHSSGRWYMDFDDSACPEGLHTHVFVLDVPYNVDGEDARWDSHAPCAALGVGSAAKVGWSIEGRAIQPKRIPWEPYE